jgi:hypothetical protein
VHTTKFDHFEGFRQTKRYASHSLIVVTIVLDPSPDGLTVPQPSHKPAPVVSYDILYGLSRQLIACYILSSISTARSPFFGICHDCVTSKETPDTD